jgi:hypothetical protein
MKAEMAQQLTKTYVDDYQYAAQIELNNIYYAIRSATLRHAYYTEFCLIWYKSNDSEARKSILRHILEDLKGNGYKVITEAERGKFVRIKIYWE